MIQFEIVGGPDQNVMSAYTFNQNQIYLGRSTGDLWINDPELHASHLLLEVVEDTLLVHPQKEVDHYLLNGKRATTIRKLKINDQLQLGNTLLKILSYKESPKVSKKMILDQKLAQLIEENSPRLDAIEALSKRMK